LEVVSAPPFEAFTEEAMREFDALAEKSDVLVVAPVFFGRGNLAPLRTALRSVKAGTKVVLVDQPPIADRDMSGGEAAALQAELLSAGALSVSGPTEAAATVGAVTPWSAQSGSAPQTSAS
jgi:iron complex transport system ATP-binding protein